MLTKEKEDMLRILQANIKRALQSEELMDAADLVTVAGVKSRDLLVEAMVALEGLKKRAELRDIQMVGDETYERAVQHWLVEAERKRLHDGVLQHNPVVILEAIDLALARWAMYARSIIELIQAGDKVRNAKFRIMAGQIK